MTLLLEGKWKELGYKSHSEADLAATSLLALKFKGNKNTIDDAFRKSKLMRDKWDQMRGDKTYGEKTINKALQGLLHTSPINQGQEERKERIETSLKEMIEGKTFSLAVLLENQNIINDLVHLYKYDPTQYAYFMERFKQSGLTVRDRNNLEKAIKQNAKLIDKQPNFDDPIPVRTILPDAPVPENILLPKGWLVDKDNGIQRWDVKEKKHRTAAYGPILIQGRLKNIVDDSEDIRVAWWNKEKWSAKTVDRIEIADRNKIIKLADYGFPVTSETASLAVKFFAEFESLNATALPVARSTHRLGWVDNKYNAFLLSKNLILKDGTLIKNKFSVKATLKEWSDETIFFKGHDTGEEQVASGFYQKGSYQKWSDIIDLINGYPLVTFGIYAALAAPLLPILDAPIYIVDWAYKTTSGKTTTLKIAASCWGNPTQRNNKSVVKSWNATRTWSERVASALYCLPLILDETKQAKNTNAVIQAIYDFASGQGRGRGSIQGIRETSHWQTPVLLSGETKAVNFSTGEGGTVARVISLWGAPLGKRSGEKAKDIQNIIKIIHKNFGHAGPMLIQYLLKNKKKWKTYKKKHQEFVSRYQKKAGNNEVALRQAEFFGTIHTAAWLAKKALNLDIKYKTHLSKVFEMAARETVGADRAQEALDSILSWAFSKQESFWEIGNPDRKAHFEGWLGVWNPTIETTSKKTKKRFEDCEERDSIGHSPLHTLGILPHHLKKHLKDNGYESQSMLRIFKDKGWLKISEKKTLLTKVLLERERVRCYVLNKKAIQKWRD